MIAKLLLDNGIKINHQNEFGKSALHRAIEFGMPIIGFNSSKKSIQCEFLFISDQEHMVSFLLDNGADANAIDYYGRSGLYMAARKGNKNIVQLLISKGISEFCCVLYHTMSKKDYMSTICV